MQAEARGQLQVSSSVTLHHVCFLKLCNDVFVCTRVSLGPHACRCLWGPEGGTRSPGAGHVVVSRAMWVLRTYRPLREEDALAIFLLETGCLWSRALTDWILLSGQRAAKIHVSPASQLWGHSMCHHKQLFYMTPGQGTKVPMLVSQVLDGSQPVGHALSGVE